MLVSANPFDRCGAIHELVKTPTPQVIRVLLAHSESEPDPWTFLFLLDCLSELGLLTSDFLSNLYLTLCKTDLRFSFWLFAAELRCRLPMALMDGAVYDEWPVRVAATKYRLTLEPNHDVSKIVRTALRELEDYVPPVDLGTRPIADYAILFDKALARSFILGLKRNGH